MARRVLTVKPAITSVKQLADWFNKRELEQQVDAFLKNGGKIKQLKSFNYKTLTLNPCGWGRINHE